VNSNSCQKLAGYLLAILLAILLAATTRITSAETPFVIDTSRLVQVTSVEGLPADVKKLLGRQKAGIEGFADKWDKFNKTDVIDPRLPMRRFNTGGAGPTSALVAYEQGGQEYSIHAIAFALEKSGWVEVGKWTLPRATHTLHGLLEFVDSEHYGIRIRPAPLRRNGPLREANLSDQEIGEIQAAALDVFPGSLLNISGAVSGCPCEEGAGCSDQVWVVVHRAGQTQGLELSRIDGHWLVGRVQQWWLSFEQVQRIRAPETRSKALQALNDSFPVCANKPATATPEVVSRPQP
jgi:hypothetical protein